MRATRPRVAAILLLSVMLLVGIIVPSAWATPQSGEEGAPATDEEPFAPEMDLTDASPHVVSDSADSRTPTVAITELTPEILTDEEEVTVKVAVEGGELGDLQGSRIGVFIHADPFTSANEARSFLTYGRNDGWAAGEATLTEQEARQAVDGSAEVAVSMPVDSLPLWNPSAWGPYGVTVRLVPGPDSLLDGVPQDRTILLWYGVESSIQSHINVTVTDVASTLSASQWATMSKPGVTLALSRRELRTGLERADWRDAEVVMVPEAGASLSLLAVTGLQDLYDLAANSRSITSPSTEAETGSDDTDLASALNKRGITLLEKLIVADSGWMGRQVLEHADGGPVLSAPEGVPPLTSTDETASSLFLADPVSGATVNPDEAASNPQSVPVLASWRAASQALTTAGRQETSALNARQWVRSLTAIASRLGTEPADLWVNVPAREIGPDPEDRLAELLDAPWVNPVPISYLLQSTPSATPRDALSSDLSLEQGVIRSDLSPLNQKLQQANAVLEAAQDADVVPLSTLTTVLRATDTPLSKSERMRLISRGTDQLSEITDVVEVVPSGTVNIVGRNAPFPVTLKNNGSFALNIDVELEASDPRLSTRDRVSVVVPGGGSVSTSVPVAAVGTGAVNVTVVAKTADGATLDSSPPISVRVRADWEGPGIWILGSILTLAFAAGLVRTIRKGRRRMSAAPKEAVPASDPDGTGEMPRTQP